jgi:ABC-type multidrug transport system ATPase subunit
MHGHTLSPIGVTLDKVGHRFGLRWVFQELSLEIPAYSHFVIRGANGSGKSTLARILAGTLSASSGAVMTREGSATRPNVDMRQSLLIGPGNALHPDLTLTETLEFHARFRPFFPDLSPWEALNEAGLYAHRNKALGALSSGMQQRVKLALALCSASALTVLDEPCANLDANGIEWYRTRLALLVQKTTTVICSNHRPEDYLTPSGGHDLIGAD